MADNQNTPHVTDEGEQYSRAPISPSAISDLLSKVQILLLHYPTTRFDLIKTDPHLFSRMADRALLSVHNGLLAVTSDYSPADVENELMLRMDVEPNEFGAEALEEARDLVASEYNVELREQRPVPLAKHILRTLKKATRTDKQECRTTPTEKQIKELTPFEIRTKFKAAAAKVAQAYSLEEVKAVFKKFLYVRDDSLIEIALAVVVANLTDGDPIWIMFVGGSSSGKTEFVTPLSALEFVHMIGTLTEASFLSGSSKRDHTEESTGGLLRETGSFGVWILKDFTSILSIHHDKRMAILAALREIYDGYWSKRSGNDGGKNLQWWGKVGIIGCCTDALESATAVTASMGERFMRYRWHHTDEDQTQIARMAMRRGGSDARMRKEIREAVCGFFGALDIPETLPEIDELTEDKLIALATFTARGRSVVDRASTGSRDIELIHDAEVPARFGVMLRRMYSALQVIGTDEAKIWKTLEKIAFDSIPKLRGEIIQYLRQERENGRTEHLATNIAKAVKSSTTATRRALEELRAHNLLAFTERQINNNPAYVWHFSDFALELMSQGFVPLPDLSLSTPPDNLNIHSNFSKTVPDDLSGRGSWSKVRSQHEEADVI